MLYLLNVRNPQNPQNLFTVHCHWTACFSNNHIYLFYIFYSKDVNRFSTPRSKKFRYPGDILEVNYTPKTSRRGLSICLAKIKEQRRKMLILRQSNFRLQNRIHSLEGLMDDLKAKYRLSEEALDSVEVVILNIFIYLQ